MKIKSKANIKPALAHAAGTSKTQAPANPKRQQPAPGQQK
jgi:hypothetical protein